MDTLPPPLLVCAPHEGAEPRVVLADGSYETDDERIYWRRTLDDEVLRLPLTAEVAVRSVRHFPEQRLASVAERVRPSDGELRLLAAVAASRPHRPELDASLPEPDSVLLRMRLTDAVLAGDAASAEAVASVMWRRWSLSYVHDALAACLADVGAAWADRATTVRKERLVTAAVRAVLERLHGLSRVRAEGEPVVLLTPPGDRHTLALTALSHQLAEAGRPSLVVDDLPFEELSELLTERAVPAVVVSTHLPMASDQLRELVAVVRSASPDTLIVMGGPGVPRSTRGIDLVTDDPARLLEALDGLRSGLTQREREVLTAVADGLTNHEIASALGLSAATVKTHLDHVFAKTGTEHRAAAVARALRNGWIA